MKQLRPVLSRQGTQPSRLGYSAPAIRQTNGTFKCLYTQHIVVERGVFIVPLVFLTAAFMAIFSRYISTLEEVGGLEKDCKVLVVL